MHKPPFGFRIVSAVVFTGFGLLAGSTLDALALNQDDDLDNQTHHYMLHTSTLDTLSIEDQTHAQAIWDYINTHC